MFGPNRRIAATVTKALAKFSACCALLCLTACGPGGGGPDGGNTDNPDNGQMDPVSSTNQAPIATSDAFKGRVGVQLALAVLDNDRDPENLALTITSFGSSGDGVITLSNADTPEDPQDDYLLFEPNPNFVGTTSFAYTISDASGLTASANVDVTIERRQGTDGNQLPVAVSDQVVTLIDTAINIDVLANDSDPDSDLLAIQSISQPSNGQLLLDSNGTPTTTTDDFLVYTPNPGFTGQDQFVYDLFDGTDTARAAVTVLVATTASAPNVSGHSHAADAIVNVFNIDAQGSASGAPIAQTTTDAGGNWALSLPARTDNLIVQVSGGVLLDDTPGLSNVANARGIELADAIILEGILLADRDSADITVLNNALLLNARNAASVLGFDAALEAARSNFSVAFGIDPLLNNLATPLLPSGVEPIAQHVMLLGGAALQLDAAATQFLQPSANGEMLLAQIRDLSDCVLDGLDANGPVEFSLAGVSVPYPVTDDLAISTLRYRNNFATQFRNTAVPTLDPTACVQVDVVAPIFGPAASLVALAADSIDGTELTSSELAAVIDGVTATDNGQVITVRNNAPSVFPIGDTLVTFTATDLAGNSATFELVVQIRDREPPVITAPLPIVAEATGEFTQVALGQATFSDNVSLNADILVSNNAPTIGFPVGVTTVLWTATDEAGLVGSATQLVTMTINGAPEAVTPRFVENGRQNTPLSISTATAFTDPDNDPLNYSISALPLGTGLSFDPTTGDLTGVPTNADALASPIFLDILADDGASNTVATLELIIENVNDAPVVISTLADRSIQTNQFVSIPLSGVFTDPDLDSITYSAVGKPNGLEISPITGILGGSVTTAEAAGSPYTVVVTASDGSLTASTSFELTVVFVNTVPTVANAIGTQSATEDAAYQLDVSTVFTDGDNDPLTLSVTGLPTSLSLGADSIISGIPTNADAQTGSFGVTLTAVDGNGGSVDTSFVLVVGNVNDAPEVTSPLGNQTATEGATFTLATLSAFTDIDNDPLTVAVTGLPASMSVNSDGQISGTPVAADVAASPFTVNVTATDPAGASATDTFQFSVSSAPNTAPTLSVPAVTVFGLEDGVLMDLAVSIGDNETAPSALTVSATSSNPALIPPAGILLGGAGANRTLTLTPNADAVGAAVITVTVSDGSDQTTDTFMVQIDPVNDAPAFAQPPALTIAEDVPAVNTFTPTLDSPPIDEAGESITWSVSPASVPFANISLNPSNGTFSVTTIQDANGSQLLTLTADDGQATNNISTQSFLLTVTPEQDAPMPGNDEFMWLSEADRIQDVLANDVEVDGEALQLSPAVGTTSQGGTFVLNDAGTVADKNDDYFDYFPAIGFSGTDSYTYSVSDGIDSRNATVTVQVESSPMDNDQDRLDNATEMELANTQFSCLDINDPDSDGDGLSDGVEVQNGSNPCVDVAAQQIFYIDDDGPTPSWPSAQTTLGLVQSGTADVPTFILIARGYYPGEFSYFSNCDNVVFIGSLEPSDAGQMALQDTDGAPQTIIDMEDVRDSDVFFCDNMKINDIWLQNGFSLGPGGGLEIGGSTSAVLNNVHITDSLGVGKGGGLTITSDAPVVANNIVIRNNTATDNIFGIGPGVGSGGGVWVSSMSVFEMNDSEITNNTAEVEFGGGIYLEPGGASVTITNSTISGNTVNGRHGGGLYVSSGSEVEITSSILSGNRAGARGGGIFSTQATGVYVNLLMTNNYAGTHGGAIGLGNGENVQVINSTMAYNQAGGLGGGLSTGSGSTEVSNSIFFNNRSLDRGLSDAATNADTFNKLVDIVSDHNMVEVDMIGGSDIDLAALGETPRFVNGYYLDQANSLAINAGNGGADQYQLNQRTTNPNGANDNGTVDLGYHYNHGADEVAVTADLLEPFSGRYSVSFPGPQRIIVQPRQANSEPISQGHQVMIRVIAAPVGFAFANATTLEPMGALSAVADDLTNGTYQVLVDLVGLTPNQPLTMEIFVDGTLAETITVWLDP